MVSRGEGGRDSDEKSRCSEGEGTDGKETFEKKEGRDLLFYI